jgi:hypothetical protein
MNLRYTVYLILGSLLFFSCSDDNTTNITTEEYKDAQIYSFSISGEHDKDQDSIPRSYDSIRFIQINKTKFAIDQVRRVIYNPDSMPYGTNLRKLLVTATFNPSYGSYGQVNITTPDSIKGYTWNKTDSVDFSKLPVSFAVTAYGGGDPRVYNIDMRIHKVDPDTILWKQMPSYPTQIGKSKTLLFNNKFYTYTTVSSSLRLYNSDINNLNWISKTLTGLPSNINVESLTVLDSVVYGVDENGNSYKSTDGEIWSQVSNGKNITSILGVLPGVNDDQKQLLVIINNSGTYRWGKTNDMSSVEEISASIPDNFPIKGCTSYTNMPTNIKNRTLLLVGGNDNVGKDISYTWVVKNVAGGLEVSPFVKNNFFQGDGLSAFMYNDLLYVLASNQFYTSASWGQSWIEADSKQMLDPNMGKRKGQSVVIDNENYIWIFGGISDNNSYYNDVWKGRLNRVIP